MAEGWRAFRHFAFRTGWTTTRPVNNVTRMQKILCLLALLLLPALYLKAEGTNQTEAPGNIDLKNASVKQVLDLYSKISGLKLEIVPDIKGSSSITYWTPKPATRAEAMKGLEKALEEQAQLVITKIDEKHARVTIKDEKAAAH